MWGKTGITLRYKKQDDTSGENLRKSLKRQSLGYLHTHTHLREKKHSFLKSLGTFFIPWSFFHNVYPQTFSVNVIKNLSHMIMDFFPPANHF